MAPAAATPGMVPQTAWQFLLKGGAVLRVVTSARKVHVERQDLIDAEPEVDALQSIEARQQHAGADEQRQREGELHGHQAAAKPSLRSRRRSARLLSNCTDGRNVTETQRRCDAAGDGRDQRHQRGKSEDGGIEPDLVQAWNRIVAKDLQHVHHRSRHSEPHQTAEAGEDQALDEHLTHEPTTARAESRANRELVDAPRGPSEHEIGDVDARDQEHESDGSEQQVQWAARRRDEIILQRNRGNGAQTRAWPAFFHRPAQARELRPGVLQTDASAQASNGAERVVLAVSVAREARTAPRHPRRRRSDPRIPRARRPRPRTVPAQLNRGSDDRWIGAKPPAPQPVAQHHAPAADLVAAIESRAEQRLERNVWK